MIDLFGWTATVLAVSGVVLNNRKFIMCFWLWMVSNLLCAHLHAHVGLWSQYWRDVAFFVLSVEGFYKWRKQTDSPKKKRKAGHFLGQLRRKKGGE